MTVIIYGDDNLYKVALYARLSIEDGGKKDNDTIENQIDFIEEFIKNQFDLILIKKYIDNGKSGTNFERPEFNNLKDDISKGIVNCIIVKDLSRLGRNFIETSEYIETIFPFYNVRFISINDNYDSRDKNTFNNLMAGLKNLFNEYYVRDLSVKIKSVLNQKQMRGEFIGGIPPYGYIISKENVHKLIPDINTSIYVKKIFEMKLNNISNNKIVRYLNEKKISSPYKYYYEQGILKNKKFQNVLWTPATIKNILNNPIYIGDMAQRKSKTFLYEGKKKKTDKSEWIIVKNTHEAIIEKKQFNEVSKIMNNIKNKYININKYEKENDELANILYCGICGKKLIKCRKIYKGVKETVNYRYICNQHNVNLNIVCSFKGISKNNLYYTVINEMKNYLKILINNEIILKSRKVYNDKNKNKIKILENKINKIKSFKLILFEKFINNIISENEYKKYIDYYENQNKILIQDLNKIQYHIKENNEKFLFNEEFIKNILYKCVHKVDVYSNKIIKINFNLSDEYSKILYLR